MATTPEEWLPILTKRLDARRPTIDLLRSYVNGDAPLPEASKNIRASWEAFQKKARTNFGELVISALAERLICNALTVGGQAQDNDEARRIWRENRMDVNVPDAIRDMLTVSIGYMIVGRSKDGRPVVTAEKPEYMYAATDPLRSWVARAAVKVWRDEDEVKDFAYVWADGVRQKFERPMYQGTGRQKRLLTKTFSDEWRPVEDAREVYSGDVPVVVFRNHDDMGEFQAHTDILDRINRGLLDRLVTSAYQAFRQRAIEGGLPKEDEEGNPVDYAAIFAPAPGALWDLPADTKIWESQESAQSIMAMLSAVKDDIRDLSAVTRTPLPMVAPEGQNQSAAGAESAKEGLVMKARDRIARIKPALSDVMTLAMRVVDPDFTDSVEVGFADPTHVTFAERFDAAVKAKAADVPWRTRMIDILGYSADKVDAMQTELEEERLAAAAFAPQEPQQVAPNAPAA